MSDLIEIPYANKPLRPGYVPSNYRLVASVAANMV